MFIYGSYGKTFSIVFHNKSAVLSQVKSPFLAMPF